MKRQSTAAYRQQLADQQRAAQWRRFHASLPPGAWQQMSPAQQATLWATWCQGDRAEAHRAAVRGGVRGLVIVFVVIPVILLVLFALTYGLMLAF